MTASENIAETAGRQVAAAVGWVRALLERQTAVMATRSADETSRLQSDRPFFMFRNCGLQAEPARDNRPVDEQSAQSQTAHREHDARDRFAAADYDQPAHEYALSQLAHRFSLNEAERLVLLLCLAFELDPNVGRLCALAQADPGRPYPTFALAIRLFGLTDWSPVLPARPLRGLRLIELRQPHGTPLLLAELGLSESVLHFIQGGRSIDSKLQPFLQPVARAPRADSAIARALDEIGPALAHGVALLGADWDEKLRGLAWWAAEREVELWRMAPEWLPGVVVELDELAVLWHRDAGLHKLALVVDLHHAASSDPASAARIRRFTASTSSPVFYAALDGAALGDLAPTRTFQAPLPSPGLQRDLWLEHLPAGVENRRQLAGELSQLYLLDEAEIQSTVAIVADRGEPFGSELRRRLSLQHRPRVDSLAQRVDVKAGWDDLILPPEKKTILERIVEQVGGRWRVYGEWGLAERMNRGLGVSALFAGDSGTGKTMAAEVLAQALEMDLYRVDLASVVNKYIGETEKHLRRLFDAFESCGAILLFDECDALFGKRSEVKDSHDRYANIEINYLLQRLETYRGLAILATNDRGALDTAFLRRLRFVVTFNMPAAEERALIWTRLLPPPEAPDYGEAAPSDRKVWSSDRPCADAYATNNAPRIPSRDLDYRRLAQFPLTGGSILNAAVNAAFRAAAERHDRERVVTMPHVLAAVRDEYVKLERPIDEGDFRHVSAGKESAA